MLCAQTEAEVWILFITDIGRRHFCREDGFKGRSQTEYTDGLQSSFRAGEIEQAYDWKDH